MFHSRIIPFALSVLLAGALITPATVAAQEGNEECKAIIRDALIQTVVNCAGNETGNVCYGFPEIDSVLQEDIDADTFDEPGETVAAIDVITLRPAAITLTTTDDTWGIVVMNILASLPSGMPDDVVVIGFGGLEIESDVRVNEAFIPLEVPFSFTTTAAGELRETNLTPPAKSDLIGQIASGTSLKADAVNQDGQWIRVLIGEQPGWLSVDAFDGLDISSLPLLKDGQLSPMQAFYLRTGIDAETCAPNASWVLIQAPKDTSVDMILYDVPMRIEGTALLRTLPPGEPVGPQMQLASLYGLVTARPDTNEEIIVPAGYTLLIGLGPDFVSLGIEGDDDERSGTKIFGEPNVFNQSLINDLGFLDQLPPDILNYEVETPILTQPSGTGGPLINLIFANPGATKLVKALCASGVLPPVICSVYGFPTP